MDMFLSFVPENLPWSAYFSISISNDDDDGDCDNDYDYDNDYNDSALFSILKPQILKY
jgi:hypothetical protein